MTVAAGAAGGENGSSYGAKGGTAGENKPRRPAADPQQWGATVCACRGSHWPGCPNNLVNGHPLNLLVAREKARMCAAATFVASRWRGQVMRKQRAWIYNLKAELMALNIGQLRARAQGLYLSDVEVQAVVEGHNPRGALIELIWNAVQAATNRYNSCGSIDESVKAETAPLLTDLKHCKTVKSLRACAVRENVDSAAVDKAINGSAHPTNALTDVIVDTASSRVRLRIEARLRTAVASGAEIANFPGRLRRHTAWGWILVAAACIVAVGLCVAMATEEGTELLRALLLVYASEYASMNGTDLHAEHAYLVRGVGWTVLLATALVIFGLVRLKAMSVVRRTCKTVQRTCFLCCKLCKKDGASPAAIADADSSVRDGLNTFATQAREERITAEQAIKECPQVVEIGVRVWAEVFKKHDKDKSGDLDCDEFIKAVQDHLKDAALTREQLTRLFRTIDSDNGGTVSAQELEEFARENSRIVEQKRIQEKTFGDPFSAEAANYIFKEAEMYSAEERVRVLDKLHVEGLLVDFVAACRKTYATENAPTLAGAIPVGAVAGTVWRVMHDADGYWYCNTETKTSVWDMPRDVEVKLGLDSSRVPGASPRLSTQLFDKPSKSQMHESFDKVDVNLSGKLSLKGVTQGLTHLFHGCKDGDLDTALYYAYWAAQIRKTDKVEQSAYVMLVNYLVCFNNIWYKLGLTHGGGARGVSYKVFVEMSRIVDGLDATQTENAYIQVTKMSTSLAGAVVDDFCLWCVKNHADTLAKPTSKGTETTSI